MATKVCEGKVSGTKPSVAEVQPLFVICASQKPAKDCP
jgi:hypothetical protein